MDRPENVTHKSAHRSRGKPLKAFAITLVSLLLAIGFTVLFNPPQEVSAGLVLKAWSGAGINSGKFENWLGGSSLKKYSPEIDSSNLSVTTKGGSKKDLTEFCDPSDKYSPQRFWFWLKDNKLASNSLHWSTEYFIGTMQELSSSNPRYDTREYQDEGDYARVERLNLKSSGLLKSLGKPLNGWGLDAYCVDIKNWYDATKDLWNIDCGRVYLQTVAGIYNGNTSLFSDLDTIAKWEEAAKSKSFSASGIADYPSHYNQWIKVSGIDEINAKFYKVYSENDEPTEEEMDPDGLNVISKAKDKKLKSYSTFEFDDIATSKHNGIKYYLQGVRVEFKYGNKWVDKEHFFILDKDAIQTQGKTSKYSKKGGAGLGEDTISGIKIAAINEYTFKYKDNSLSKTNSNFNSGSDAAFSFKNEKYLSGTQKYDDLVKHIEALAWKTTNRDIRVCLVYQEVEKGAVKVQREFYDWDEDVGEYKELESDTKKYHIGVVKSNNTSGDFVLNDTDIDKQEKDANGKYRA